VYCLDADDGSKIWEYATSGSVDSSPVVYDGKIYIGSQDNTIYCFKDNSPPLRPAQPIGPTKGNVNEEYTFATTTTDHEGNPIDYWFDWGDGTNTGWTESTASHMWTTEGSYSIKVKARDTFNLESGWSEPLGIEIVGETSEEPTDGWIFGTITDDSGPINEVSICVTISEGTLTKCASTDEQGVYRIQVEPGIYTVEASKTGYTASSKSEITVSENNAFQVDFTLELVEDEEIQHGQESIDFALQYGINEGIVKGEITVSSTEPQHVTVYDDNLDVEIVSTAKKGEFVFTVAGPEGYPGTVIALRIDDPDDFLHSNVADLNDLVVTFDETTVKMAASFGDIFNPTDDSDEATWAGLITEQSVYIIVSIPHFSKHTISISSIAADVLSGLTAIFSYMIIFIVIAIAIVAPIVFIDRKEK